MCKTCTTIVFSHEWDVKNIIPPMDLLYYMSTLALIPVNILMLFNKFKFAF
mgnify:CR=1 FL=1